MVEIVLFFPICLTKRSRNPLLRDKKRRIFFIEEEVFFGRKSLKFNKKKLVLYRAGMKEMMTKLKRKGYNCQYFNYRDASGGKYLKRIEELNPEKIHTIDPTDLELENRLKKKFGKDKIVWYKSPLFICSREDLEDFTNGKEPKRYNHDKFYRWQRKRLDILMTPSGEPKGGKWSYDPQNREALPKDGIKIPPLPIMKKGKEVEEAMKYVDREFSTWWGSVEGFNYPVNHREAKVWLRNFIRKRLKNFGRFQDAIEPGEAHLFHSVVSPLINIGLLGPMEIVDEVLGARGVSLASKEGFIRQVIGWREYMRLIYLYSGESLRKGNYFGNNRKLSKAWYNGTTGIEALDDSIIMGFRDGYLDHIKRLMIVCNLMNMAMIHPDEIWKWFMEFSVDSYDWVMIGNVYGMGTYADGGRVASKPYISSSAYLTRMSRGFGKDEKWDSLFWNFVAQNAGKLEKNGRVKQLVSYYRKKTKDEKNEFQKLAREVIREITKK